MAKDGKGVLDFIAKKSAEKRTLFESDVFNPDTGTTDRQRIDAVQSPNQSVSVPSGLPTISPDVDLKTMEPIDYRGPATIDKTPTLANRIGNIFYQPVKTTREYMDMARRGDNPIAAGIHLGKIIPEAAFAIPMAIDEALGITRNIGIIHKPLQSLAENIDLLRETVKAEALTPGVRMRLKAYGINPKRAEEIIDETFGVGQHVAGLAAFMGGARLVSKGIPAGVEYLSKRRSLSESIDAQIMKSVNPDRPPLPDLPPGGIPGFEGIQPPTFGERGIRVGPEGNAVPQQPLRLPAAKADIGGFKMTQPDRPLTTERSVSGTTPHNEPPPMMIAGVDNVIRETGYPLKFEGYDHTVQGIGLTDNMTGSTFHVPFNDFNAKSVNTRLTESRRPFYEQMRDRGIGTLEEYMKIKNEGRLDEYPIIPRDIQSLATKIDEPGKPRPAEPIIPPPTPFETAPIQGGVPSGEVRPIQELFTKEGRIRTGAEEPAAPRGAEPVIPRPSERPPEAAAPTASEIAALEESYRVAWKEYLKAPRGAPPPERPAGLTVEQILKIEFESTRQPTPAKSPKVRKIRGEGESVWVNIKDVVTRLADFQERETPYAEATVRSIMDAVENGTFVGRGKLPSIELWKDPATGELVNVSGHSRIEAYRRLASKNPEKYGDFNEIKATIFEDMTFEQAKTQAAASNLGAQATPTAKAKAVRDMRQAGLSEAEIAKRTSSAHGKQAPQILALSHLEPNGRLMDAVRQFVERGEATSGEGGDILQMAQWIGKVKEKFPNLNARHENEIFDFLRKNYKTAGKKFRTEAEFNGWMEKYIEKHSVLGKVDELLNFEEAIPKSRSREEIEAGLDKEIGEIDGELNKVGSIISRKLLNYKNKGLDKAKQDELLKDDRARRDKLEVDKAAATAKRKEAIGALEKNELNLFEKENDNPTYKDAIKEVGKRIRGKGKGDKPSDLDNSLPSTLGIPPFDASRIPYILEPIITKLQADAQRLVKEGSIAQEDVGRWISRSANELLQKSDEFRQMSAADRQKVFKGMREKVDRLKYDPSVGRFYDLSKTEYDNQRREENQSMRYAVEESGKGADPNKPSLKYDDGTPALYNSRNLSNTYWGKTRRLFFNRMGKYVADQTGFGSNLVESMNFVDRRSGQWAESHIMNYTRLSKKLSNGEFDEFITKADEGGTSPNANVNEMLTWWRATAKELIDRARAAGLETTYAEITKNAFGEREMNLVTRPIGEREFYFPHEYDWKKLTDVNYRQQMIEGMAKSEGISMSEAADLYNRYLKHRSEVKYGNLEKPRLSGDKNWSRERDVIPTYIERSTRRILTAEVMGKKNANALEMIDKISEHGGDAWAAKELMDRWLGADYPTNMAGAWLYELSKKVGSWQVATKLQMLFMLNPSQINNSALLWGSLKLIRSSMSQFKDFNEWRDFAHRAAAITDQTISMHMKEALSMEGIGGKVMDWTGVKVEERLLRANAAAVGASVMERFGKRLNEPRIQKDVQSYLRILQLDKQIDMNQVRASGGFSKAQLQDIGFESARSTQFLSRPQDMPAFFSTPEVKLFNQFKQFAVQQTALLYDVMKENVKNPNPRNLANSLTMLGVSYPVSGAIVSSMRDAINGRDRKDESEMESYMRNTAMVGSMGILYDMLTQSSYNQTGFAMYLAGPTVGDATKIFNSILNPESLPLTLSKQVPIPGLQQILSGAARPDKSRIRTDRPERKKRRRER